MNSSNEVVVIGSRRSNLHSCKVPVEVLGCRELLHDQRAEKLLFTIVG